MNLQKRESAENQTFERSDFDIPSHNLDVRKPKYFRKPRPFYIKKLIYKTV